MRTHPYAFRLTPSEAYATLTTLHALACKQATHQHLGVDLQQDCAQDFVLHAIQHDTLLNPGNSCAYLNRFASNFTHNFRRHHAHITCHEITWPQQTDEEGVSRNQEFAASAPACDEKLLHEEAEQILRAATQRLTVSQRDLLTRHFFHDETFVELAEATGSAPDAVRMTIARALKRLRVLLPHHGMTPEDACEYLREMARARGGGRTTKPQSMNRLQKFQSAPVRFRRSGVL